MDLLKQAENINLSDYTYTLPEKRIAKHPLEKRDHSKLMVYKNGTINHQHFYDLPHHLPEESLLIFNNTKVIPARIHFKKQTGATIEIFLLSPILPTTEVAQAMLVQQECSWNCMIGNRKRWKKEDILERYFSTKYGELKVSARYMDYSNNLIKFEWDNEQIPFVEIVEMMGTTPLPPYLNRSATEEDKPRYQTIYSKKEGAVAAPTAGLHFTEDVFTNIKKSHKIEELTLHVGAGTFQPIKSENVLDHEMHCEQITVEKSAIKTLALNQKPITAVGTTSVRTLESLYWFGYQLLQGKQPEKIKIKKLYPYETAFKHLPSKSEAFTAILKYMDENQLEAVHGETEIFIFPAYQFQVVDALITNFHQPESTLILLIAAFLGENWKEVYQQAMENEYRFLSYGDSSLLIP